MIHFVQVIPYDSHGVSVRVGKGIDSAVRLEPQQCEFFDFVETPEEIKRAIKYIKRLPDHYRHKDTALEDLEVCLQWTALYDAGKRPMHQKQWEYVEQMTGRARPEIYVKELGAHTINTPF